MFEQILKENGFHKLKDTFVHYRKKQVDILVFPTHWVSLGADYVNDAEEIITRGGFTEVSLRNYMQEWVVA